MRLPRAAPADFLALTKPRITLLVVATVAAGFLLAPSVGVAGSTGLTMARALLLVYALIGSAFVAGGTNALNQVAERDVDARMLRTARRPLPAGRLTIAEATMFAWTISAAGVLWLAWLVNVSTAVVAALTLVSYVLVYTPLKRRTTLATLVGAVPGALPVVGGWLAAGASAGAEAGVLFTILFLWQLPHFLALSWLYRDDYRRADLRMLSVDDADGRVTFRQAALAATALLPAALAPAALGVAGGYYALGAMLVTGAFVALAWHANVVRTVRAARRLFLFSLVWLPAVLSLMLADRIA